MSKRSNSVVSKKVKGLFAPPPRLTGMKDPRRRFRSATLAEIFAQFGQECVNPWCDSKSFPLNGHHIYAHCFGGRSVIENALVLCTRCHRLVHSGTIPLCVQIAWRTGQHVESLVEELLFNDELIAAIQSVPVSITETPHQRLLALNSYLVQACDPRQSEAARLYAFAEIMLAKAAVLNDAYPERHPASDPDSSAMKSRYAGILPFGSCALKHARAANHPAAMIRALHYRSIAYDTMSRPREAIKALCQAWTLCEELMNRGRREFHALSQPGRILRSRALIRVRMNGDDGKASSEFNQGLSLADAGNLSDYNEAQLREVQFCLLTSQVKKAEKKLADVWLRITDLDANSRLLAYRMAAELDFAHGEAQHLPPLIDAGIQEAVTYRAFKQEYHFRNLALRL
jgi:hypothetical protein